MRLFLIRHGKAKSQTENISNPSRCAGLTETGFQQVEALASRILKTEELKDCQLIFSSPVLRARQTTEILVNRLSFTSFEERIELYAILPGEEDHRSQEVYESKHGTSMPPKGESWEDYSRQVGLTLKRYSKEYLNQTVVAVTHAEFIVASINSLLGNGAWLEPGNTAVTEWYWNGTRWSLIQYNSACHLSAFSEPGH